MYFFFLNYFQAIEWIIFSFFLIVKNPFSGELQNIEVSKNI